MENPLKFRRVLLIVLAAWLLMLGLMQGIRNELTIAQSLILPLVLFAALTPLSVRRIVGSNRRMTFMAVWAGLTIPGMYFLARWVTGYGSHCDRAMAIAGALCFVLILGLQVLDSMRHTPPNPIV